MKITHRLAAAGVNLSAQGGNIHIAGKPLNDKQRAWVGAHKAELLAELERIPPPQDLTTEEREDIA